MPALSDDPAAPAAVLGPLQPEDLAELGRFLTEGFGLPAGVECFSPAVLRWKYLDPGPGAAPRSLLARAAGRIIGHAGICPRVFTVRGEAARTVSTSHCIDWLAAPSHPYAGLMLLRRGGAGADTQYSIGGSAIGQKILRAAGFVPRARVGIFRRVLRPLHRRLALPGQGLRKSLGIARDLLRLWRNPARPPTRSVELRPVSAFGAEVDAVLDRCTFPVVFSSRTPDVLNYYLAYPGGNLAGWTVHEGADAVGFALLNVTGKGVRQARVVDCFLAAQDEDLWHAAVAGLVEQARARSADEVLCFASTPWLAEGLRRAGFAQGESTDLLLRDRKGLLPPGVPFHVTHLEGDHAYLE
jgi:hypothetical protein